MNASESAPNLAALVAFNRQVADEVDHGRIPEFLVQACCEAAGAAAAVLFPVEGSPAVWGQVNADTDERVGSEAARTLALANPQFDEAHAFMLVSGGGLYGTLVALYAERARVSQFQLASALADTAALALDRAHQTQALVRSISDLQASREELRQTEQLRVLGQMAAVVAHEVRNPLASVTGVLQVLQSRFPESSGDREIIGKLLVRVGDLNELLEELLQFARPRPPQPVPLNLSSLLKDVVTVFRSDPATAGVVVTVRGQAPDVFADPSMIRRVVLNLTLNAAQAMGGDGSVELSVSEADGRAVLDVVDDGPGIPAELLPKIFEPFFTTKSRGSGLGLAVTRRAVEAHDGTIELHCPAGGGTRVRITLPALAR